MYRVFSGTLLCKIRSGLSDSTARLIHWFVGALPLFWNVQLHLNAKTVDKGEFRCVRSTQSLYQLKPEVGVKPPKLGPVTFRVFLL